MKKGLLVLLVFGLTLIMVTPCFAQEKYRISASVLGSFPITTLDANYEWSVGFGIFIDRQVGEHSLVGFSYAATKVLGKGEWTDLDLQNYAFRTKFNLNPLTEPWNLYLTTGSGVSLIDPGNSPSETGLGLYFGTGYTRTINKTVGLDIGLDIVTLGVFQNKPVNTLVPHVSAYFPFSL